MSSSHPLQQRWYERRSPPAWTLPLAALYGGACAARRALYRRRLLRAWCLRVPVVVVGNLVAGGTGKTPLTIALVRALRERGWKPGVVSRGYGGSARTPQLLDGDPDPAVVGDEPALIRRRADLPVAVGADRVRAAHLLLADGVDVIVADDGLQHYALARDVEICVIDGERRFGNGWLLPAGPLREPLARLAGVDFVVANGGDPRPGEIPMRLALGDVAVAVDGSGRARALGAFGDTAAHAVAGIGHPGRFFAALRARGLTVIGHPFPDHHRYTAAELAYGSGAPVLMTEKDAVKCRAFARSGWWSVPVSAELPRTFFDAVTARLRPAGTR
ncbi:MAG TPA: tetraacyldisaccharide 4'-kinase [Rhodanobacteraceae bacterium]|nr:tetraacyldisaccharide 4'-kinase [Rhodanobacteraceae bacterium]